MELSVCEGYEVGKRLANWHMVIMVSLYIVRLGWTMNPTNQCHGIMFGAHKCAVISIQSTSYCISPLHLFNQATVPSANLLSSIISWLRLRAESVLLRPYVSLRLARQTCGNCTSTNHSGKMLPGSRSLYTCTKYFITATTFHSHVSIHVPILSVDIFLMEGV